MLKHCLKVVRYQYKTMMSPIFKCELLFPPTQKLLAHTLNLLQQRKNAKEILQAINVLTWIIQNILFNFINSFICVLNAGIQVKVDQFQLFQQYLQFQNYSQIVIAVVVPVRAVMHLLELQPAISITEQPLFNNEHQCIFQE
ncbi:Hypothetical_protein [Hexamita inflata]|uniref:Hypothetical_protein n=1 Tax=Hexamita inflata TaxID=28002 RepID=A0AA86NBF0_9EUKA|nr:Hypothetical protein HINF_LOCUS3758 [Hexamita inflata]